MALKRIPPPTTPSPMDHSAFNDEDEVSGNLEVLASQYVRARVLAERTKDQHEKAKERIKGMVERYGEQPDADNGSRFFYLAEPLPYDGTAKNTSPITGFKVEHRSPDVLDIEAAEVLCKKLKIWDAVTEVIPEQIVLSEDLLLAAAFRGDITDEQLKALYQKVEQTPAFKILQ